MWKFEIQKRNDGNCRENGVRWKLCSYTSLSCIRKLYKAKMESLLISQLELLKEAHFKKIELSDSILVVNINNYIGNSTNLEIEYAKKLGKEIIYYIDLI